MHTTLDCIPCFVRQALGSSRLVSTDTSLHEQVLREVLKKAADIDMHATPPEMGQTIHRVIRSVMNSKDPFCSIKKDHNQKALAAYEIWKDKVRTFENPFAQATRLAIAANAMDFGAITSGKIQDIPDMLEAAANAPLVGDVDQFENEVASTDHILYLADNAGEIVFDRLLIELIGPKKVTLAVRGHPVINDVTKEDADMVGLSNMVEVIDNGSDAPGTILKDCSADFQKRFEKAPLVIAKGQGNFETLSHVQKNIVFLLKAKCPVITEHLGCALNTFVVRKQLGGLEA